MNNQIDDIKKLHPGVFLQEQLKTENMSQHDLAVRTGVTEKHISTIIAGTKAISVSFAKKLEYALDLEAKFWLDKQSIYDCALAEFEEENDITAEETKTLKSLKEVIDYYEELGWLSTKLTDFEIVLNLRKIMGISNLSAIPNISYDAAYRAQVKKNSNVDPYVLYAWQRTCELLTKDIVVADELNVEMLKQRLDEMKKLMFEDIAIISEKLTQILSECGIAFKIVRNFVGAPVQGFIKKTEAGKIILCITLRGKKADGFWFTFFHEIGHILHNDLNTRFVDIKAEGSPMEIAADDFARNCLLNEKDYVKFLMNRDFSLMAIQRFALSQNVKPFVVIGRLHKEEILEWNVYDSEIDRYDWAVA